MALNFTSPINFNFNDTEAVEFSSVEQCQQWAEQERFAWKALQEKFTASNLSPKKYRFDFTSQIKPYENLYNSCSEAVATGNAEQYRPAPDIKYDDGAPVHWFDILIDKMQSAKGQRSQGN